MAQLDDEFLRGELETENSNLEAELENGAFTMMFLRQNMTMTTLFSLITRVRVKNRLARWGGDY